MNRVKKYLSLMKCGFLEGTAYRASFFTSLLASFIQVIVLYYVWKSVFSYQDMINGYTWETMRKYVFVSFLCNSALSFGFEMQTANKIIDGEILMDLLKPISYRSLVFFKMAGTAGIEFLLTFLLTGSLYFMVNPASTVRPWRIILFIISLLLGQCIKFNIQYLFSLLCFYTDNAYGVLKGREIMTNFFSGAMIPLVMFPEAIRRVIVCFPFSGIVFIPCSIFIGTYDIYHSVSGILFQLIWNIILFLLGGVFWKKASKVISLYGG